MSKSEWAPIPAAAAGADMGRRTVQITKRMTMAYAAGIGAVDDSCLDDVRPGGVVAPLSYSASLEWPMMIAPSYLAAIGRDSATVYDGLVHAFQDSRFFRPVRPGMSLEVVGRVTGVKTTPAGALVVCKIVTTDRQTGAPVTESWFGSMFRTTAVESDDIVSEAPPALRMRPEVSGESVERLPIDVPKGMAHVYTECADIWNPIHTEREFALASGLPDIILHGTCTLALAMQRLAARLRPDSEHPFLRVGTRFSRMVVPGAPISLEFDPTDEDGVAFDVRNSAGELALTHGIVVLA
jgi:acyl dehydratase